MAYTRGDSKNIIVGAAAMFVSTSADFDPETVVFPDFVEDTQYIETLTDSTEGQALVRNIGYTTNGLELQFQPDFGEVQVDQLLDVAKLYKQGMQVNLATAFAEATLENLLVAIAAPSTDYDASTTLDTPMDERLTPTSPDPGTISAASTLDLTSGAIGECPVERGLVAVGPGTGDCDPGSYIERIYIAYRALSIDNVTVSAKRDEASMFEVSFRLLPANNGSYGKIVDRTVNSAT
jgi:hypothetical protein